MDPNSISLLYYRIYDKPIAYIARRCGGSMAKTTLCSALLILPTLVLIALGIFWNIDAFIVIGIGLHFLFVPLYRALRTNAKVPFEPKVDFDTARSQSVEKYKSRRQNNSVILNRK
jgi:uncharacterized membrane protein